MKAALLSGLLALAGLAGLAALAAQGSGADTVAETTTAGFAWAASPSENAAGPPSSAVEEVELPDSWSLRGRPREGYGWYRVPLAGIEAGRPAWVYIPRFAGDATVYLDDVPVWSSRVLGARPTHNAARPALFALPERAGEDGPHVLQVRLGVDSNVSGALSTIFVGDAEPLHRWARQRNLLQRDGVFLVGGIVFATGLYLMLLWTRVKRERGYLLLGIGGVVWSLRNVEPLIVGADWPQPLGQLLDLLALCGHGIFFGLFGLFMLEQASPHVGRHAGKLAGAIWVCIVGSVASVLLSPWLNYSAYRALGTWLVLCAPLLAYLIGCLIVRAMRERSSVQALVAALAATFFVASVYDNLVATHRLPLHWIYVAHYAGLLFFLCFAVLTIGRFSRLLREHELLNATLDQRVRDNEVQIARQFGELMASQRQRVLLEERDRIARDLHDGLGSQLVGAIHEVRAGSNDPAQLEEILARCLDDMRLAIDSANSDARHLPSMLGALRYRMERRLQAAGITLIWDVEEVPGLADLEPSRLLNLLRLLQEGFTNTLKHARASTVAVRLRQHADAVELRYEDNGRGMSAQPATGAHGQGLENMRRRAQAGGFALELQSGDAGTTISVRLPRS